MNTRADNILERVAKAEEKLDSAHKRIGELDEKKLSKHEFNGFVQVMEGLKIMFSGQFDKIETSTNNNTSAIMSLQTTFENMKQFLPALISTIKFFGTISIILLTFIGSKLMGWW